MRNAFTFAKKELSVYFTTPIAYVMFALVTLIGSFFFLSLVGQYQQTSMFYMRFNNPEVMNRLNFMDMVLMPLTVNMGVIFIFVAPFLTMRLLSEERKQKTMELLLSTPVTSAEIVIGKYIACCVIMLACVVLTLVYPLSLQLSASTSAGIDWPTVIAGDVGLFLLGCAFMAVGLFFSALTESQMVAALATFMTLLISWVLGWRAQEAEGVMKDVVQFLSSTQHIVSFAKGNVDAKDLAYFFSVILFGLFLSHRAVEAQRWS